MEGGLGEEGNKWRGGTAAGAGRKANRWHDSDLSTSLLCRGSQSFLPPAGRREKLSKANISEEHREGADRIIKKETEIELTKK